MPKILAQNHSDENEIHGFTFELIRFKCHTEYLRNTVAPSKWVVCHMNWINEPKNDCYLRYTRCINEANCAYDDSVACIRGTKVMERQRKNDCNQNQIKSKSDPEQNETGCER